MTKPTSAACDNLSGPVRGGGRRRAFTLVELLVVIGIIILLVGILTPMVTRSYRAAERARVAADLQAIANALEAYKQDHTIYPQPDPLNTDPTKVTLGSDILYRALIGGDLTPARPDGFPGPGFRARDGGKVWGPYLQADRFKVANGKIIDRYRMPILYYVATGKPNINLPNGYVADRNTPGLRPLYDVAQNKSDDRNIGLNQLRLRLMLGDWNNNGGINPPVSANDPLETPGHTGPFLLWSTGPDLLYGPDADTFDGVSQCDDVTNFRS